MNILVKTIEDEIFADIDSNLCGDDFLNQNLNNLKLNIDSLKKIPSYVPLRYLYENLSLGSILKKDQIQFNKFIQKIYLKPDFELGYKLNTADPILVGVKTKISNIKSDKLKFKSFKFESKNSSPHKLDSISLKISSSIVLTKIFIFNS